MMKRYAFGLGALMAVAVWVAPAVALGATSTDISNTVTQSYNADASVLSGMLVEVKSKSQNSVQPLPKSDVNHMLGAVVPLGDATLSLTPVAAVSGQVLVAPAGRYEVLVSTEEGVIKNGDYLTVGSLPGIAVKAGPNEQEIVGRAAANFSGNGAISKVNLKNSFGTTTVAAVGRVPVDLRLSPNPLYQKTTLLPAWLVSVANNVAHKPVSTLRIYTAVGVLVATLFIVANLLFSGVRSALAAIGRNPLAKKSIFVSLFQLGVAGIIIFDAGVAAVYLILKL